MSHPNYAKGVRLEREAVQWFRLVDPRCMRSFMSRGKDVVFTWLHKLWTVSCKSGKRKTISRGKILRELEKHDICVTKENYDPYPLVSLYIHKFVEILGISKEQYDLLTQDLREDENV